MELLATSAPHLIGPSTALVLLGAACLLPPLAIWVRSRRWQRSARDAVRGATLFAAVCGVAAVAGWLPTAAPALALPQPVVLGIVAVLLLTGARLVWRAPAQSEDFGWQRAVSHLRILDVALNASKDGVLVTSFHPEVAGVRIVYANPAFEHLTGYGTDEAYGQSPSMLIDESPRVDREAIQAALRAGTAGRFEVLTRRKDGSRVWVEWNIVPVPDARAGCEYRIAVIRDITERRRTEEQLLQTAKMEAVGRVAAGVAHDFNNLLTVIAGNAALLQTKTEGRPDAGKLVDEIRFASDRASWLVRQLLTFSRPEPGARQIIDPNAVTAEMAPLLRRIVGSKVRVEFDLCPEAIGVEVDRSQFEQIIMNLAVNARDAMPEGGHLRIRTSRTADTARLDVSDTGCGMSAAVQARIFEPFFTTKGPEKGTGLGLATVHRVLQQQRGSITVKSAPGSGTTFRIELPLSLTPTPSEAARGSDNPLDPGSQVGAAILLVDDEPGIRALSRAVLEQAGHHITEAADGSEALEILASGRSFDLLLTDLTMPGVGGEQVAERAQVLHPGIPIVLTSAHPQCEPSAPGLVFLSKPFSPADLVRTVRQALVQDRSNAGVRELTSATAG